MRCIVLNISVVECPNPSTRTCAKIIVTAEGRFVGSTGKVTCSVGYFLMGNDTITCLDDGVWSPIKAICNTCVLYNISSLCLILIYERIVLQIN